MKTDEIRKGLRNIYTRATTIDIVSEEGKAMIDNVLPLLQDRNEGVRWSSIKILTEIGDERVVGPLITLLEQKKNAIDVLNALRTITGEELGDTPTEWRKWAMLEPEERNATGSELLSDEELLEAAITDLNVTVSGEGQQFNIAVSLPEGRSQQVWVDFSQKDVSGRSVVQLCTPCGEADGYHYETVLKMNMSIAYGAIGLANLGDTLSFAMVDSYLRDTVHPEDLAESIISLAENGDSVEKMLSAEDRY